MMTRNALVSGASIAGLSAAYWLARTGWDVTLIERSRAFRAGGQNVDIRGAAHEVITRMGIVDAVSAASTTEEGSSFVDESGRVFGVLPAAAGDGLTAELEVLRGDLARIILDALPASVEVRYGETIEQVEVDPGAEVVLASGERRRFDVVVVAEGVRSATRDRVFGPLVRRRPLGVTVAYGTIPRVPSDDRWWRWLFSTRRRQVTLRPDDEGTIRATLAVKTSDRGLATIPVAEALRRLAVAFRGVGWEADRVAREFQVSDDVYIDDLTQIRMPRWHRGRVCVVGDAAWSVTPICGGGTALALTGGYVLAASLAGADADSDADADADVRAGFERFEAWMRPLITKTQRLPPGVPGVVSPRTAAGLAVLRFGVRVATSRPLRRVLRPFSDVAEAGEPLPAMA